MPSPRTTLPCSLYRCACAPVLTTLSRHARATMFVLLAFVLVLYSANETRAQWTTSGTNITNTNTGNVGINTTSPGSRFDISGKLRMFDSTPTDAPTTSDAGYLFGSSIPSGLITEVGGEILNFGINTPQFGTWNNARTGGLMRIDTRAHERRFVFHAYPTGGASSVERLSVHLDTGDVSMATNGGNVGVGTLAPAYKFDVGGRVNASGGLCIAGDCKTAWSQVGGGGGSSQWTTGGSNIHYTAGNVGIGTSAPIDRLHVKYPAGVKAIPSFESSDRSIVSLGLFQTHIFERNFGAYFLIDKDTANFKIYRRTNNVDKETLTILNGNGNVGIGTTNPEYLLDVKGSTNTPFRVRDSNNSEYISTGIRTGPVPTWTTQFVSIAGGRLIVDSTSADGDNDTIIRHFVNNLIFYPSDHPDLRGAFVVRQAGGHSILFIDQHTNGNVGIGTTAPASKLHVAGDIRVDGNISAKYQDVAEWVPSKQQLAAGTVVVLDVAHNNHVTTTTVSYDTRVAGVVSAQPGIALGEAGEGKLLVATTGRVKVKVDATSAPIQIGDLLVTSDVAGVAIKSEPVVVGSRKMHAPGTIIGKALEPLEKGTGEILVLLSLQ